MAVNIHSTNPKELVMHFDAVSKTLLDLNIFSLRNYIISLPSNFDQCSFPKTYSEIIKWQFNRLPSKPFQKLLKCASIIGRKFSIEELCAVWPNVYPSPRNRNENTKTLKQYLLGTLLLNDYFEFFERCCDKDEEISESTNASDAIFQFRFSEVRQIIRLEMMTESERLVRQKNLISYYEQRLQIITEPVFIPLISYHYSITYFTDLNNLQKRIKYLLMLGSYLCKCTESFMEAQYIFMQVDRILEKYGLHQRIGPYLSSEWDLNMAITFANSMEEYSNPHKSIDYLISGLSKLGYEWPSCKEGWKKIIIKNSAIVSLASWKSLIDKKSKKNKIFANDGSEFDSFTGDLHNAEDFSCVDNRSRWRQISSFLSLMSNYLSKINGSLHEQLACHISLLSIDLQHNHRNLSQNVTSFIYVALMLLYIGHTNVSIYIFKNFSNHLPSGETLVRNSPESFSLSMVYLTATGNWEMVDNQATDCMKFCKSQGCNSLLNFRLF